MRNTLVIGDLHAPYEHKHYLSFCKRIEEEYKCDTVFQIGDIADLHSISFHTRLPELPSPEEELCLARNRIKEWVKAFPKMSVCIGNHDDLIMRQAEKCGIPKSAVKDIPSILNFPKTWKYQMEFIDRDVLFFHGTGIGGLFPYHSAMQKTRMSCVIGHHHSKSGFCLSTTSKSKLFGCSVGCGIDIKSPAYDYGKHIIDRPVLSCAVINYTNRGTYPTVIPMELR